MEDNAEIIAALADAIRAYASGDAPAGGTIVIALAGGLVEHGVAEQATKKSAAQSRRATAKRVFQYWQQRCDHPKARMTPDRLSKVIARLGKDGYTEADIRTAIDGAAASAYVDENGVKHDDLELICRSGSKLEAFIQRGQAANGGDVHADTVGDADGGLELQIQQARRQMATAYRNDDQKTYKDLEQKLKALMEKRK